MVSTHDFVTAQEAADILGVSAARVRQLPDEGKLPQPVRFGPKASVWMRADVEQLANLGTGEREYTAVSELMSPASTPLLRSFEGIVDFPGNWGSTTYQVHVRIWRGRAPEGERDVVVLGALSDRPDLVRVNLPTIAAIVDANYLDGRARSATWILYHSGPRGSGFLAGQDFENVIFEVPTTSRDQVEFPTSPRDQVESRATEKWRLNRLFSRSKDQRSVVAAREMLPFSRPRFRRSDIAEVERVIGERVECYPAPAYTEATITRYLRGQRRQIEVEDDRTSEGSLMTALARLESVPMSDPFSHVARRACPVLADEIHQRTEMQEGLSASEPWWDGTTPESGARPEVWPTLFAARLVPVRRGNAQERMLSQYPIDREWPWSADRVQRELDLLRDLHLWLDDVDKYGDHPAEDLEHAVRRAIEVVRHWLKIADFDAVEAIIHPTHAARIFGVVGDCDRKYLQAVRWRPAAMQVRGERAIVGELDADDLRYGTDVDNNVVVHSPSRATFGVYWPIVVPAQPYPAGSFIVADGEEGSRPVYVETPDGTLRPLPSLPAMGGSEWNFGYSGGGPSTLTSAIERTVALTESAERSTIPHAWIDDQVCYSSEDSLRISVDELRKRLHAR